MDWYTMILTALLTAVMTVIVITAGKDEQEEQDRDKRFEELRETYKLNLTEFRDSYNRDIDELEAENKRLKEQIKILEPKEEERE